VDVTSLRDLESSSSHNAKLLDRLSSRLPIACVEWDQAGLVTSWSPGATALLGWQGDEVVGEPVDRFIPIDIADRVQAQETLTVNDLEFSRVDGSVVRCALLDLPNLDAMGRVSGHTVVFVRQGAFPPNRGA
jgi:PAS domain S-box-containing protein